MFKVSKKAFLAIQTIAEIAYSTKKNEQPIPIQVITGQSGIPRRYLESVMQHLVRNNILDSIRGPKGGYILAKESDMITLGDIARTIMEMEKKATPLEQSESEISKQVIVPLYLNLMDFMMNEIQHITIRDICDMARKRRIMPICTKID